MRKAYLLVISIVLIMILPAILCAQEAIDRSSFRILEHTSSYIDIEFQLPQWNLETENRGNQILSKVVIPGANYLFIDEEETLPIFSTAVAIPYSGGAELSIQEQDQSSRTGLQMNFGSALASAQSEGRISGQAYPETNVLISEPKILRDYRIVTINVMPFQYDRTAGTLKVNDSMRIRLNLNSRSSVNEMAAPAVFSRSFESIYRGLILNYDQVASRTVTYTNPTLLVVYGYSTDSVYQGKVAEYITWKRQKGFTVNSYMAPTASTTSDVIKAYIQNQYNNASNRPDYIVLIGDVGTTINIPTISSYVDYQYTLLAGNDNLGDAIIGRISIESADQLNTYISKLMAYEKELDVSSADWLNRMLLVGDTASSGISTIYTNEYVHDVSYYVNPDYTYNEVYNGSPSSTTINAAINQGVAFYNYRGYIGMSGWPSSMSSMYNTNKMFHAVFITCNTGTFGGGTSTTEQVVRYGTAATKSGAITAIGMATSSTHTPMNNCLNVGIFHGIYPLGMRDMGEPMLYGKLYLNMVYGVSNPAQALNFSQFCNLIGDPTASVYVGIPKTFNTTAPTTVLPGSSTVEILVRDNNNALVDGASVTLTDATGLLSRGFSNEQGRVVLVYPTTQNQQMTITVDKADFKTTSSLINMDATGGLYYSSSAIDDNNSGSSVGNSNGVTNSGETIELSVTIRNSHSSSLTVSGTASSTDPWLSFSQSNAGFGTITAGSSAINSSPIVFTVNPNCPNNHVAIINLSLNSALGNTVLSFPVAVYAGNLVIQSYNLVGATGNHMYPGNEFPMTITVANTGSADMLNLTATLTTTDPYFEIVDEDGYYNSINQGATTTNSQNTFTVHARGACVEGMVIPLTVSFTNVSGLSLSLPFTLTLGQSSVTDPLGQDSYGYFIFDEGDTGYDQCPSYEWIGIAPAEGGSGTQLTLTDPGAAGDEGDQVGAVSIQTVNLPFPFTFYGVTYTQASISSNGFIAFGATSNSDWRNWRLPDAGGPNPMIAAFWDDLDIVTGAGVYTHYNAALHYYVVEWYNLVSGYDGSTNQTFQAILFDPSHYPTHTNDGQIKLQYKSFHNIDIGNGDQYPHGNYCTIGIKDHSGLAGLEYTYNNTYPTAAAPLSSESALFISTRALLPNYPYIALDQVFLYDENEDGQMEAGEIADLGLVLGNRGLVDATNVSATISSSDPYIQILESNATYGTIPAQDHVTSQSYYAIQIEENCPVDHQVQIHISATGTGGPWTDEFVIIVRAPKLVIGAASIHEINGDFDGILDPGETATISLVIHNEGLIASPAGSASMSCSTTGITVNTGTATFPGIPANSSVVVNFSLTAAASMTVGTYAPLNFVATAGEYTANRTETIAVGIIKESFETGDFNSFPWVAGGNLSWVIDSSDAQEGQYSAKSGSINHNQSSVLQTTRVLSTNGTLSFWYKVSSESGYDYLKFYIDGVQQNSPGWSGEAGWTQVSYPVTAGTRLLAWEYNTDTSVSSGSNCAWIDNIVFPPSTGPSNYNPPSNLTAVGQNGMVSLTWQAPISGIPTGYKIYRNSQLLATVTQLSYNDTAVTNGVSYSYYTKAVYSAGESDPTNSVSATPMAHAPENLTASSSNLIVNLTWQAPSLGTPLSYKIYRNNTLLTSLATTSYSDLSVSNGTNYSYYVTAVYSNPTSESASSNIVSATPNAIAPTNLIADEGNTVINLSWSAAIGRTDNDIVTSESRDRGVKQEFSLHHSAISEQGDTELIDRSISGYRVYRNGVAISTIPGTSYQDTGLINGLTYSYYVTTIYANPAGESVASNTIQATPTSNPDVVIEIGNGTGAQTYPMDRYYNYSTHEAIYLASEIAATGEIKAIGYYKASGANVDPIENVTIYLKHTQDTSLSSGDYTLTDYTQVYSGSFVNSSESGWMSVNLNPRFVYDGESNISLLIVKGYQAWNNDYPQWSYTATASTRARQQRSDNAQPTSLVASTQLPNLRLQIRVEGTLLPPRELVATPSIGTIHLAWQTPASGEPESYKLYRNGSLLQSQTELEYYDIDVTNGTSYTYYVTAVYAGEESSPSNSVQATPTASVVTTATIGSGTMSTANNTLSPINITYRSVHGQSVYTVQELNNAGVFGPIEITQLGYDVVSAPIYALPNYMIRMKHTSSTNAAAWNSADGMTTVYTAASYTPTPGGYDMLTFSTPFVWNGVDNIVVDTAFNIVQPTWNNSGTLRYTSITNGFRFNRSDSVDQTNLFTGGYANSYRPNISITCSSTAQGPDITVSVPTLSFGAVELNTASAHQFSIENSGDQVLAGYITAPNGYTVALSRTVILQNLAGLSHAQKSNEEALDRSILRFILEPDESQIFDVTFLPTTAGDHDGNIVITSNSSDNSVVNLGVTGSGYEANLETPSVAIEQTGTGIRLSWPEVSGAGYYKVYKSTSPDGIFELIATVTGLDYDDESTDRAFYYVEALSGAPARQ